MCIFRNIRQRRPDRAVYVPRHRRSLETGEKRPQNPKGSLASPIGALTEDSSTNKNSKFEDACCVQRSIGDSSSNSQLSDSLNAEIEDSQEYLKDVASLDSEVTIEYTQSNAELKPIEKEDVPTPLEERETLADSDRSNEDSVDIGLEPFDRVKGSKDEQLKSTREITEENQSAESVNCDDIIVDCKSKVSEHNETSDVLVISDINKKQSNQPDQVSPVHAIPPEKKAKKIERQKSKPVPPPSPSMKINRDECDWDSLFDDNGDCLDPTLIEEVCHNVSRV